MLNKDENIYIFFMVWIGLQKCKSACGKSLIMQKIGFFCSLLQIKWKI